MEKYNDVMKRILELTETIVEGLTHIRNQVNEGYFEASIPLFSDVVSAFASIENSIWTSEDSFPKEALGETFETFRNALYVLTEAYEQRSEGKALEILQFNVIPTTKKWKVALEKSFEPYLVS